MKSIFTILLMPLFLISCIEVRDADKEQEPVKVEVKAPTVTVEALDMPHRYLVTVKGDPSMTQVVRRPVGFFQNSNPVAVGISQARAEEIVEVPGQYEYSIQQNNHTFLLQVEVPEDFVVEGNMKWNQLPLIVGHESDKHRKAVISGRLFFKSGATITLDGENLHIKSKTIESEGSVIQTFSKKLKAKMAVNGQNGGDIKVEAESVRGSLHFIMRGEDGGDGEIFQSSPIDAIKNDGGKGGNSGLLEIVITDKSKGSLSYDLFPGEGGEGREVTRVCLAEGCPNRTAKAKGENGQKGMAQQPIGIR